MIQLIIMLRRSAVSMQSAVCHKAAAAVELNLICTHTTSTFRRKYSFMRRSQPVTPYSVAAAAADTGGGAVVVV